MSENAIKSAKLVTQESMTNERIENREKKIKTGFRRLDRELNGGISKGLIVLGAGPSGGKSTFALQLAQSIASSDQNVPVLYYSLEMADARIISKLISRKMFLLERKDKTHKTHVTSDDLFNSEKADFVLKTHGEAFQKARRSVMNLEHLYIIEEPFCARQIKEQVLAFAEEQKKRDETMKPPFVIVDYLQIIPPDKEKTGRPRLGSEKQQVEENLEEMKVLAKEMPVLLISSLKRGGYSSAKSTPIEMEAFKESGGIEYSADLLLGLQYTACDGGESCDTSTEKRKSPREVSIRILKQRYGSSDETVRFHYYSAYDYFEEAVDPKGFLDEDLPVEKAERAAPPSIVARGITQGISYMNNTKVANEIRKGIAQTGKDKDGKDIENLCVVSRVKKRKHLSITYTISNPLSCLACDVADAIYTLWRTSESTFFTTGQVLRALSCDPGQTVTDQKKIEINHCIYRLMNTKINIDCTEEMKGREKITSKETMKFDGNYLSAEDETEGAAFTDKDNEESKAKKMKMNRKYRFDGDNPMPLYAYAATVGQFVTVPNSLLAMPEEAGKKLVQDTMENIMIKRYLIRRLETIRYNNNMKSRSFRYLRAPHGADPGMISQLDVKRDDFESGAAWRHKCKNIRTVTEKLLDHYVKMGYIQSYQVEGEEGVSFAHRPKDPGNFVRGAGGHKVKSDAEMQADPSEME